MMQILRGAGWPVPGSPLSVAETADYVKKEETKIASIAKDLGLSKR